MCKITYILSIILVFTACSKDDEPENKDPQYNPETQTVINGLIWDKKITKDYCLYDDALEIAEKAGKRLPTEQEVIALFQNYTYDEEKFCFWFGSDSNKKEQSENSVFLELLGRIELNGEKGYFQYSGSIWVQPDIITPKGKIIHFKNPAMSTGVFYGDGYQYGCKLSLILVKDK